MLRRDVVMLRLLSLFVVLLVSSASFGLKQYYVSPQATAACNLANNVGTSCSNPCNFNDALGKVSSDGDSSEINLCTDANNFTYNVTIQQVTSQYNSCLNLPTTIQAAPGNSPVTPVIMVPRFWTGSDYEYTWQFYADDTCDATLTLKNLIIKSAGTSTQYLDIFGWGYVYVTNVTIENMYLTFDLYQSISGKHSVSNVYIDRLTFKGQRGTFVRMEHVRNISIKNSSFEVPDMEAVLYIYFHTDTSKSSLLDIVLQGNTFKNNTISIEPEEIPSGATDVRYYGYIYIADNTFENTTINKPSLEIKTYALKELYLRNNRFSGSKAYAEIYYGPDIKGSNNVTLCWVSNTPSDNIINVNVDGNTFSGAAANSLDLILEQRNCLTSNPAAKINLLIKNNTFSKNKRGLDFYISPKNEAVADINGNTFTNNYAEGALGFGVSYGSNATLNIENNTFTGNTIKSTPSLAPVGGAIRSELFDGTLNIKNNTFTANDASLGGAISLSGNVRGKFYITDNEFSKNTATGGGGAIHIVAWSDVELFIERNTFDSNKLTSAGGNGGCVYIGDFKYLHSNSTGYYYIRNNLAYNNYSPDKGGCVYFRTAFDSSSSVGSGGPFNFLRKFYVINNTFYSNKADGSGDDLFISAEDDKHADDIFLVQNNTFWSPSGGRDVYVNAASGTVFNLDVINNIFSCNDFSGNGSCLRINDNSGGGLTKDIRYNFSADPKFKDPANGDFHLTNLSPAIDSGKDSPTSLVPNTDFEGDTRPLDGNNDTVKIVDIGADEFVLPPATATKRTLNVTINGGCGGVVSTPQGINCPGTCSAQFFDKTNVLLTAGSPFANCQFNGWDGDCKSCGNSASCLLTMDKDINCTANFQQLPQNNTNILPLVSLTANPTSGNAPLSVNFECGASDLDGWVVEIRWDFDGDGNIDRTYSPFLLSGSGFTDKTTYVYQSAGNYTAKCTAVDNQGGTTTKSVSISVSNPTSYKVSVGKVGDGTVTGGNINCGNTCSTQVNAGSNLTLNASAGTGYTFEKWEGDCSGCGANTSCALNNIQSDKFCLARFKQNPPSPNNPPTTNISANPTSGNAPLNVNFTCNANDSNGDPIVAYYWDFDGDGNVDSITGSNTASFIYTSAGTYDAKCKAEDSTGAIGNFSSVSIQVNAPPAGSQQYTLTVQAQGVGSSSAGVWSLFGGISCPGTCTAQYNPGVSELLGIWNDVNGTPPVMFDRWGGDCSSCGSNWDCTIVMNSDKTCIAYFKANGAPVINSLTASPNPVLIGNLVTFTCNASDPNGDALWYWWDLDGDGWIDMDTFTNTVQYGYLQPGTYDVVCMVLDPFFEYDQARISVDVVTQLPTNQENLFKSRRLSDGSFIRVEEGSFSSVTELGGAICDVPKDIKAVSLWMRFTAKVDTGKKGVWIELELTQPVPAGAKIGKCTTEGFKLLENVQINGNKIRFYVEDGSEYDYDGRVDGYVRDPFAVVVENVDASSGQPGGGQPPQQPNNPPSYTPTSGGGGGGCSTGGFSVLLSLLVIAIPLFRRLGA